MKFLRKVDLSILRSLKEYTPYIRKRVYLINLTCSWEILFLFAIDVNLLTKIKICFLNTTAPFLKWRFLRLFAELNLTKFFTLFVIKNEFLFVFATAVAKWDPMIT